MVTKQFFFVEVLLVSLALFSAKAADSVVVFNEIQYHPAQNEAASEWIELHNLMAIDIDLSAWSIRGDVQFTFAEGTVIPPVGFLVIASDPGAWRIETGITNLAGPFSGRLNNTGGTINLLDRNDRLMDAIRYSDGGKWPVAPDGSGVTLAKRNPNSTSALPENWTSSVIPGGTPGGPNFPVQTEPQRRSLISMDGLWLYDSGTDLGTSWKEPTFNDRLWAGRNNATLVSYWPFNGNASAARGANGSLIGGGTAAADRSGQAAGALAFIGPSQQYVSVPGGGGLDGASSATISMWVKWSGVSQDADCCGTFGAVLGRQANGLFSDNIIGLSASSVASGRVVWRQSGGPAPVLITGTSPVGTNWHHIAVTFSSTSSSLYVDGVLQGSGAGAALHANASTPLTIGAWASDGSGYSTAAIDDVAIWDQSLGAAQIAQLAGQSKTPLDFAAPEGAVYYSGDGRLTSNDELRRTALPPGPVTRYFRAAFDFADDPLRTDLQLDCAVDDGAVFHLNGREVYRHNMPPGSVSSATLARTEVLDTPVLRGISISGASLVRGANVFAVEVHQASQPDSGMVFGAALTAIVQPGGPAASDFSAPDVRLSEISAASANQFRVELVNHEKGPINMAGWFLQRSGLSTDAEFILPSRIVEAGDFLVLDQTIPGFTAIPGDKLFLLTPSKRSVVDSVEVHARPRARGANSSDWFTPDTETFGATNQLAFHDEIVINEIMYHAPPPYGQPAGILPNRESTEQWIELFNRSTQPVNLDGWRLDEAVDFRFGSNTVIPAGGYIVIANAPADLLAKFPGISVVGSFTNSLTHRGGRIVLKDGNDNPANVVPYFDDGRWPEAADGGGSSLELRDPRSDNSAGESWAASDETSRTGWRSYSYRGVAAASQVGPDSQWREFVLGLLDAGEVLLDDISVRETPSGASIELLQNSTFDAGTNHWRIIGNHHGEVIDDPDRPGNKVLHLKATGPTEHMSNHAETTYLSPRTVVNGREYQISFRAKWLSGSPQLHTRLYFNRLPRVTLLETPRLHGTPGARNSTFRTNTGPTFASFSHSPPVPAPLAPVTVSVRASDPDGVESVTLWSVPEGGAWSSLPMSAGAAGLYSATLPGRSAGTVVQLYVEAADHLGAIAIFPAGGRASRALYKVDDGRAATNGLHNIRLVTLTADANVLFRQVNLMSNERIGCTMIYDEKEIFYDAGLRLKGSEHSRTTTLRLGFNVAFPSDHLFRGIHSTVAIDRSESTGFGQREMLIHQMLNHAGGVPAKYHDLIQVIAPRNEYTGSAELQLARYSDVFLADQYENGADGTVFEYELIYQLNATDNGSPEGNKLPAPDSVVGSPIRNMGDDRENYRWTFLIKNNEDRDDYRRIISFAKGMQLTGAAFNARITNEVDIDQFLRGFAANVLTGAGDSYGGDGSQHNVQFYARPSDGKILYFPHDMDAFFDATRSITPGSDLPKIISVSAHARTYYGHLQDIIATTYNANYLGRWAAQFGRLLPSQPFASHLAFITQRANYLTSLINSAVPNLAFALTNGGTNFTVSSGTVTLSGTAPLSVKTIEINGVAYPVNWISRTAWSLQVPMQHGLNPLTVQGVNRYGVRLPNALLSLTVTNSGPSGLQPVVINEWMADNAGPAGYADPVDGFYQDWFELFNPNETAVDLGGWFLTDNEGEPGKFKIPNGINIPARGFLLVWADNEPEQNTNSLPEQLHAAFQLNNGGEFIGLFSPAGVKQHGVEFGAQRQNISQGLFPDGAVTNIQSMATFTPKAPNTLMPSVRIAAVAFNSGTVTLNWIAAAGRSYRIEFKDRLEDPSWTSLGGVVTATTESTATSVSSQLITQRFYRIAQVD